MKEITTLFLSVLLTISAHSQSYLLSFSGTGASTNVDSVKIENITQGTSLTVKGTDVLNLDVVTGITQTNANTAKTLKVYPNPSSVSATVEFFAPNAGIATISIYNLLGMEISTFRIWHP